MFNSLLRPHYLLMALAAAAPLASQPLATPFTYQGTLSNAGLPAEGLYDFEFRLYDALSDGNQIGPTQTLPNVVVQNGIFTVQLDFGSTAFTGAQRFLDTRVAPDGNALSILSPRLQILAQPYALYSRESGTSPLFSPTTGDLVFSNGTSSNLSGLRLGSLFTTTGNAALQVTSTNGTVSIGDTTTFSKFKVRGSTGVTRLIEAADTNNNVALVVNEDRRVGINNVGSNSDRLVVKADASDGTVFTAVDEANNVIFQVDTDGDVEVFDSSPNNRGLLWEVSATTGNVRYPGNFIIAGSSGNTGVGNNAFNNVQLNVRSTNDDAFVLNVEDPSGNDLFSVFPNGNASVFGNFNVFNGNKNFTIDHPQNPDTQWLSHNAVEGPGYYTHYQGTVTLNADNRAEVTLPAYFESLNGGTGASIHYQLTPIGAPMPQLHVSREVKGNTFEIAGGIPGAKVSWLVNAERRDPYALAHPYQAETEKSPREKGFFAYPQGYGATPEKSVGSIPQTEVTNP
jgi:hypothetical protein